ncbi:MAG: hypothetical protein K0Q95_2156 [Bacteroidota bacterium]|jgi:hypothetical protein|nr:hypothetical protein [Bacteroidota bacterium]
MKPKLSDHIRNILEKASMDEKLQKNNLSQSINKKPKNMNYNSDIEKSLNALGLK